MTQVKCGVIGVGYLGQYHAQKYHDLPNTELVAVCDIDHKRCDDIAERYNTQAFYDYRQLLDQVDAVSIVVPTNLHHTLAKTFMQADIHVLIEKPIANTVEQARELVDIAETHNTLLQVGHLERFNNVIKASERFLNNPKFIESERLAPFKLRGTEVNVVLDLMIHDIDIIQDLMGSPVKEIKANGASVLSPHIDIAHARIEFENQCVANVKASRVSLKAERKLRIFQYDAYLGLDLKNRKLSVHRKGEQEMFPGIPEIISEEQAFEQHDALKDEIAAFADSIINGTPPKVSGHDATMALETAIAITEVVNQQYKAQTV